LVENSRDVGAYFKEQLEGLAGAHPLIGDVRGRGLLMGVELVSDRETRAPVAEDVHIADKLNERFKKYGLILRMSGNIINIGPPICITEGEVDEIIHALDVSLWEVEGEMGIAQMA